MIAALLLGLLGQQNPNGLVLPNTARVRDALELSSPATVHLGGLLGDRYLASERNRLLNVDEDDLLGGYRHRPGSHPWIGEHVGKWLHAASLAYVGTHDPALLTKLKRVANGLIATQEPDGYLGTYEPSKRFGLYANADWDVWSHKYCLIGLLTYYQVTHDQAALNACQKVGDLLIRTFGPGKKSIVTAGTHNGMAATSVLEPMVLLYRATADRRYLAFARQIVKSYDDPGGPHIIRDLLATGSVAKTANGKAYEMLSNLVGLCELYRATGDTSYLLPAQVAWNDIASKRIYLTGAGSSKEHWSPDGQHPNDEANNVGETCVSVTWMQFNLELLRITGDVKYVEQIERVVYNHLLAAQRPDGAAWCYYTPLEGRKHPGTYTTCCLSSGPRGIALLPTVAYASRPGRIDVNLFGQSTYTGELSLRQSSGYPYQGQIHLEVTKGSPKPITVALRIPVWARGAKLRVRTMLRPVSPGTYATIRKVWSQGEKIDLELPIKPEVIDGVGSDAGHRAMAVGPLVLAADLASNKSVLSFKLAGLPANPKPTRIGPATYRVAGSVANPDTGKWSSLTFTMMPFYIVGQNESPYTVWFRNAGSKVSIPSNGSVLTFATESASRVGNQTGSIVDGVNTTQTVTYDGTKAEQDWFAAEMLSAKVVNRAVFVQGECYHDGGWFDTSTGKPTIQVQVLKGGPWTTVATLASYPLTDGAHRPNLKQGQRFEVSFPPVKIVAIRVVGKPSFGDGPSQAFSSCAELQAFGPRHP